LISPSAYLDTNLLLFARDQLSPKYRSASTCLAELIRGGAELYVSQLVFDEMWWQLFRASFRLAWNRELTGNDYKRDTSIWRDNWPRIRQITNEILEWQGIRTLASTSSVDLVKDAAALLDENALSPRDAFHLALVLRHSIASLVTADPDFDRVTLPRGKSLTIIRF
jgi:predicted nucleic acid-binding protein